MAIFNCKLAVNIEEQELTQHGTLSFPVAAYESNAPIAWHWHEELEVAFVVQGRGIVAFGSEKISVNKGDGFFINSGVLHAAWSADTECRFHSLVFHPRLVGGSEYSIFWEKYLNPLIRKAKFLPLPRIEGWQKGSLEAIEGAWRLCEEEQHGYEFLVREYLSRLVLLVDEHSPALPKASASERRNTERIKEMLQFIHEHFSEALNTKRIAKSASVSESECLRCFHKVLGVTPIQYLKRYRLRRAEHLLTTTDIAVSEVAHRCGFQELSYFSKTFREKNTITPSEYRRQQSPLMKRG